MAQVDVLLGILAVEVDVVQRLTKVWGARHARVPIGDIKSTRVTCIPITVTLDGIGIGWYFITLADALLSCSGLVEPRRPKTAMGLGPTGLADCWGEERLREDLSRLAIWRDPTDCVSWVCVLMRWSPLGCKRCTALSAKPASSGQTAAAVGTATIVARVASAAIANIERNCVQSFNDLV